MLLCIKSHNRVPMGIGGLIANSHLPLVMLCEFLQKMLDILSIGKLVLATVAEEERDIFGDS